MSVNKLVNKNPTTTTHLHDLLYPDITLLLHNYFLTSPMTRPLLYTGIHSDIFSDTSLLYSPSPKEPHTSLFVSGISSKDNSVNFNFLGSRSDMRDTDTHALRTLPISPSKNLLLQPIGTLPEPHVDKMVLASIRSAKVELERLKKHHAQDGLGIRRMEDYITILQERERAKADSALGSSYGSNSGSGDSGSERRRLIEKSSETPYRSPLQSTINRPIGLEATVRKASQIQIRKLEQDARDATKDHKSATALLRTEQMPIDHLTHYNQLLKEQILSRRQILDRLENTELEHERIDPDSNNELEQQQKLKQRTLELQLSRQQRFEPKRNAMQMDTGTKTEVKEPMTARELRETLEQERRQRQNYRHAPPPNTTTEKDPFRRHDPGEDTPDDEKNSSRLHQWVQGGEDIKPKNDLSHHQTSAPPAVVIENDDSLYAVTERSIRISEPAAAVASSERKNTAAHKIATPFLVHRPTNIDSNTNNDNKRTSSSYAEESTIRPCQPPADALDSVIQGLEDDLAISKQKLSELVRIYNDHNAALRKRVRKSLALRIERVLAETERKSDYLYSLHDVAVVVGGKGRNNLGGEFKF